MHIEIQEPRNKIKFVSTPFEKSRISFPGIDRHKDSKLQRVCQALPSVWLCSSLPLSKYEVSKLFSCLGCQHKLLFHQNSDEQIECKEQTTTSLNVKCRSKGPKE